MSQSKPMLAAGDLGNSQSKFAIWGDDGGIKCLSFKSRVKYGAPAYGMATQQLVEADTFKLLGEVFTVEEGCIGPIDIFKVGQDSLAVKALALAGLSRIGLSGHEVYLATNLPLGVYLNRNPDGFLSANEDAMLSKIEALRHQSDDKYLTAKDVASSPRIVKGVVGAEGYTAYIDSVVSDDGVITEPATGKKRGVLDIGGGTTDIGIFSEGFEIDPNFITINIGTLDVHKKLEARIQSRWPDYPKVEPALLDSCVETGKFIDMSGTEFDLSEEVTICKREVAKDIIKEAKSRLQGNVDFLDKILLVGGGGQMLQEYFADWLLVQAPYQPEFANVRGLLKLITFLSGIELDEVVRRLKDIQPQQSKVTVTTPVSDTAQQVPVPASDEGEG